MASKTTFQAIGNIAKLPPDYKPDACRWIDGHGKEKIYSCPSKPVSGRSYCEVHLAQVYTKPPTVKHSEFREWLKSKRF